VSISGTLTWTRVSTGKQTASVGYHVNTLAGETGTIRLDYTTTRRADGQKTHSDYAIGLTTTPLPWGGLRWWLLCPLVVSGRACGRRVGKLYMPPGGRYFGCRHCYDLTYQSTRDCHQHERIARLIGWDPEDVREGLRGLRDRQSRCSPLW